MSEPTPDLPASSGPVPAEDAPAAVDEIVKHEVRPELAACVAEWNRIDPGLRGRVTLSFRLDERGLRDVAVVDQSSVPAGTLGCLSDAVWAAHWPSTSVPVTVSQPFAFEGSEPELPPQDTGF